MSGELRFVQMLGFELDREAPDGPTVLHVGKRLLFVEADVRREGEVMAVGQATFVPVVGEPG